MVEVTSRGTVVILVVEDEPLIRLIATDVLAEAGFEVVEAANADEAVQCLETRADIRIVFSDIDMPGAIDGIRLAAKIRKWWPTIGVALTSGNCTAPLSEFPERCVFIPKPYDLTALVVTLQTLAA